jgi:hypothetical protein
MKSVELIQDAATFGPATVMVWLLILNAGAVFALFVMLLGVKNKLADVSESIQIFDADTRADMRTFAEILRCYFFQRTRPRDEDLSAIGTKEDGE